MDQSVASFFPSAHQLVFVGIMLSYKDALYPSALPMRCNNGYVKGISIHVANSSLQIWMKIKQMFIYLPDKDVMAQDRFPRSSFPYSATLDQTSFDDLSVGWTVWFQEDAAGQGGRGYGGR